jgi:hypothetical protein
MNQIIASNRSLPLRFGNVRDDCEVWVLGGALSYDLADEDEAEDSSCRRVCRGAATMMLLSSCRDSSLVAKADWGAEGNFLLKLRREDGVSADLDPISVPSLLGSGVNEGQLDRELSSDDRSIGELARELEDVVLVDLERDEGRGNSVADSAAVVDLDGSASSSITSTTWPFGATTS